MTVGPDDPAESAEIDVVIAPRPPGPGTASRQQADAGAAEPINQTFGGSLEQLLGDGIALVSSNPIHQRYAWRTKIASVSDGSGARSDSVLLGYDANADKWQETTMPLPRAARSLVYVELVDTRRDLDAELRQQGTAIRRILNDLQVPESQRNALEQELRQLGDKILQHSSTLGTLRDSLNSLDRYVDAIGDARVDPVPRTLEELARSVGVSFGADAEPLASRLHGSGVRSLASFLAQDVFYGQTLGIDGGDIRPHPVTLVEEPESHLHPHAIVEVANLLSKGSRQAVATTHSPLLATAVAPASLRLVRRDSTEAHEAIDFGPAKTNDRDVLRTKRPELYASEMEKLTRSVERPFGELLFARAVVIGDGATERAFLPPVLREALGPLAHGISVIDSAGMHSDVVGSVIKFACHVGIPLVVFADSDEAGRQAVEKLLNDRKLDESSEVVWSGSSGIDAGGSEQSAAIERMMIDADPHACIAACGALNILVQKPEELLDAMKKLKGSIGGVLASEFIERHPYGDGSKWPDPLLKLVEILRTKLGGDSAWEETAA